MTCFQSTCGQRDSRPLSLPGTGNLGTLAATGLTSNEQARIQVDPAPRAARRYCSSVSRLGNGIRQAKQPVK